MGLFDKLFGKKPPQVADKSKKFCIDIREDCFVVNGQTLEVPIHIESLKRVLGQPRKKTFHTSETERHVLEALNKEQITNRTNYYWDDLGLKCYTNNGGVVNCFAIVFRHGDYNEAVQSKMLYGGNVTIMGEPWLEVMKTGEDCHMFRQKRVGYYSLTAEYVDFDQPDETRTEKDFTGIEIQLDNGVNHSDCLEDEISED